MNYVHTSPVRNTAKYSSNKHESAVYERVDLPLVRFVRDASSHRTRAKA